MGLNVQSGPLRQLEGRQCQSRPYAFEHEAESLHLERRERPTRQGSEEPCGQRPPSERLFSTDEGTKHQQQKEEKLGQLRA